jgi:hypothetical protein
MRLSIASRSQSKMMDSPWLLWLTPSLIRFLLDLATGLLMADLGRRLDIPPPLTQLPGVSPKPLATTDFRPDR